MKCIKGAGKLLLFFIFGNRRRRGARATAKPWLKGYSEKEYLRAERNDADRCTVKVGGLHLHNNGGVMPSAKGGEEVESRHVSVIPHGGFLHALPSRTHANAAERAFCYVTPALRALSRLSPLQRGARATAEPWIKRYSEKEYLRAERNDANRCTVKVGGLQLHNNGGVMPSAKVGKEELKAAMRAIFRTAAFSMPCPPALTLTPPNTRSAISRLRSALCHGYRRSSAEHAPRRSRG